MARRDTPAPVEPKRRRQRPPRPIRKLKLIRPVSWMAVAAVIGGIVAAALIASR